MTEVLHGLLADPAAPWASLSPGALAWVVLVVFVAFFVRGYAGFGASLIAVSGITLVLPPATVVPAIFLLEILASISLLPGVWRDADWRAIGPLLVGCVAATPLGIWALAVLPEGPVRIAISATVVATALALLNGGGFAARPGTPFVVATGAASGFLNGLAGIGGPPAVLFFFATPQAAHVGRASLIVYFLFTDIVGLGFAGVGGIVDAGAVGLFVVALVPLALGIWAGNRRFIATEPAAFRRAVLILLIVLGIAGIARAALA
jgi:uncharacterized membrane protein YfcA